MFGIIHPENPEFALVGDIIDRALRACGHAPARRIAYALNIATAQNEHTNAIAQMKAAGVTTVLCVCDEFSPIFLTRAADQQHYGPEWVQLWWPDPWQRLAQRVAVEPLDPHRRHVAGLLRRRGRRRLAGAAGERATRGRRRCCRSCTSSSSPCSPACKPPGPNLTPETVPAGLVLAADHAGRRLRAVGIRPWHVQPPHAVPARLVRPRCPQQLRRPGRRHPQLRRWAWFRFDDAAASVRPRTASAMTVAPSGSAGTRLIVVVVLLLIVVLVAPTR